MFLNFTSVLKIFLIIFVQSVDIFVQIAYNIVINYERRCFYDQHNKYQYPYGYRYKG